MKKTKIKKYDYNTFSDITKQTILSSQRAKNGDILDTRHWPTDESFMLGSSLSRKPDLLKFLIKNDVVHCSA